MKSNKDREFASKKGIKEKKKTEKGDKKLERGKNSFALTTNGTSDGEIAELKFDGNRFQSATRAASKGFISWPIEAYCHSFVFDRYDR